MMLTSMPYPFCFREVFKSHESGVLGYRRISKWWRFVPSQHYQLQQENIVVLRCEVVFRDGVSLE